MRYMYQRGRGSKRRVMHLCGYDQISGEPTMQPICGRSAYGLRFDTTCNFPLGLRVCKRCRAGHAPTVSMDEMQ